MSALTSRALSVVLGAALTFAIACADPECPGGYIKVDNACHRVDGGVDGTTTAEGGVLASAGSDAGLDGGGQGASALDAAQGASPPAANLDSATPAASNGDAGPLGSTGFAPMSTPDAGGMTTPAAATPECDATHPCSAGFVCSAMKCASACTQTQCDPNATCSLVANAPVCACNRGFIAMTGSGGAVTCTRDVACEELGCDVNARCEVANQLRSCVCKNGYTGNGKTCTPVSCPTPTIANGTVSTPDGATFGKTATYQCSTGYKQALGGSWTRTCGADMQWSGTAPSCTAITCLPLTSPANGTVSTPQGREYGDPADYACNTGYKLQGSAQRICQDLGWSGSAPTCVATCGNGVVDFGEQCDPKAPASSAWTCMPTTCQLDGRKIYRFCEGNADCDSGQACIARACVLLCSSSAECPATPLSSGSNPRCVSLTSTSFLVCMAGCATGEDCPPGLACEAGKCNGCSDQYPCRSGQRCVITSGNMGRCY